MTHSGEIFWLVAVGTPVTEPPKSMDRPRIEREMIRMGRVRSASIYPASDWSLRPGAIVEIRAQVPH